MMSNLIRQRREALGLSQGELVQRLRDKGLDVTRAAVSHWETGRNPSPFDYLIPITILAQVLGISRAELFNLADNEVVEQGFSELALTTALIVDRLSREGQDIALQQLKALEMHFAKPSNMEHPPK